jgi:hypothetical protein
MLTPPNQFYLNNLANPLHECVLPALRELLATRPQAANCSPETLARLLWEGRYQTQQPADHEVEEAMEALRVEGEVLA